MPYVPSEKTDGKSQDRNLIDVKVEALAREIATTSTTNFDILRSYKDAFNVIGVSLYKLENAREEFVSRSAASDLAETIYSVGSSYNYQGAFLGELNYAITRLIQRVPQIMVELGKWPSKDEIRYWLYAVTVEALTFAADIFKDSGIGISGVFEDIKDEYKRRVNVGYEAAQIIKSGDCYDTPYYTRLVEVVSDQGEHIGYQEVMLKRSEETLHKDVLDAQIVLRTPVALNK